LAQWKHRIMQAIRDKVLELFEQHRETPGAPYDESHFLDFLLVNPRQKNAMTHSFRGLRRLNAFRDQIQNEFMIFFSSKDRDTNYSLERFVARIAELQNNPAASLASMRRPMQGRVEGIVVFGPLAFFLPAFILRDYIVLAILLFTCGIGLLGFFLRFYRRERLNLQQLHHRIKQGSLPAKR